MKKAVIGVVLIFMFIVGITGTANAYLASSLLFSEGFDLDTATSSYDPTILIVLFGPENEIEKVFRPETESLADFNPTIDFHFDFNIAVEAPLTLVPEKSGLAMSVVHDQLLGDIEESFTTPSPVSIHGGDIVVLLTAEGRYFKMSNFRQQPNLMVAFEFTEINTVPEPSTLACITLGLFGFTWMLRRRRNRGNSPKQMTRFLVLLLVFGTANLASGQQFTLKKAGTGVGTVMVGDRVCGLEYEELRLSEVERAMLILKALPEINSHFAGWEAVDETTSMGRIFRAQPGDTVIAVFEKNEVIFDVEYTEGELLEPQPRGKPDESIYRDPKKKRKAWSEMFSKKYSENYELNPGDEKSFPLELLNPSMVCVKIYHAGDTPEKLSVQLFQEGQDQAYWSTETLFFQGNLGIISDQIAIPVEMTTTETAWKIQLVNSTEQVVTLEVLIGLVDLRMDPK